MDNAFNVPQHLIPFFLLIGAFLTFLQYVDRVYKEALLEVKSTGDKLEFKLTDNPIPEVAKVEADIKKLYDKITNPRGLRFSRLLSYVSSGLTATLLFALGFLAYQYMNYFRLIAHAADIQGIIPPFFMFSLFIIIVFPIMCIVVFSMRIQVWFLRKDLKTMEGLRTVYNVGRLSNNSN